MKNDEKISIIQEHLGFLEYEYGFSLREHSLDLYYLESQNCEITIVFELWKVYVSIGPIRDIKANLLKKGVRAGRVNVKIISRCLNPNLTFDEVPWNGQINIADEFAVYVSLLKKYCKKMIEGDFSEWVVIQNCLKQSKQNSVM